MVYNQATGLMYLSVAGSQGLSPSANSVVSFDPLTGTFGTPILVGSEPNQLALSSDGSTLWVGLDGASAVRQVDLTHNVAAYQFSVVGANDAPLTVSSLSALPGSPDSVIVGSSNDSGFSGLAIYDHGVVRASLLTLPNPPEVLQVDSMANRVIVGDYYGCSVYGYSAAGIAPSASPIPCGRASGRYGSLEITDGKLYSDQGYVSDITTSASLGQIDFTNPPYATGLLYVDSALGRIFSLHQTGIDFDNPNVQIVAFKHTDLSRVSPNPLPLYTDRESVSDLLRWGTNGLAFRNNSGVIALQSNLVNDLSTTLADLATTVVASGGSTTGTTTSFSVTVTNNGPQPSTGVALSALLPATGNLIAATPSLGNCSVSGNEICDLGNLPAGASAKVVFQVLETSAGAASLSVHATGAETDPTLANNTAADTLTITGAPYNASPALQSIAPAAILAGSADTKLTLLGTDFSTDSLVTLDGNSLATTFLSATQLQAIVPATKLAPGVVLVNNPAPGSGLSQALPLTVYSALALNANHIVYDPYTRKIMASVGSATTAALGNSIVAITPEGSSAGTPVAVGSDPDFLALSADGQALYTTLQSSQGLARFNMLTQTLDFTAAIQSPSPYTSPLFRGLSVQPGTENTLAVDLGPTLGEALYDIDPTTKTAALRGQTAGPDSGTCPAFLDANRLLTFDSDARLGTLQLYSPSIAGLGTPTVPYPGTSLGSGYTGCFQLSGQTVFTNLGRILDLSTNVATEVATLPSPAVGAFMTPNAIAPDLSLHEVFYLVARGASFDGVAGFSTDSFTPTNVIPFDLSTVGGATAAGTAVGVDLVRWGQDGLALLSSTGHLYRSAEAPSSQAFCRALRRRR